MSHLAHNADDYAATRLNVFFPGVNPELDGQCVSLVKWFMQEMSDVPNPQAARGDARYVGKTLVAQGLAVEVPYAERRRGDIICLEYGTYGHIYVQLSNGKVFEENVGWPGVASKVVAGGTVYASRIGSDSEAWRHDQHAYRLNSYSEIQGEEMITNENQVRSMYIAYWGRQPNDNELNQWLSGGGTLEGLREALDSNPAHTEFFAQAQLGKAAQAGNWEQTLVELRKQIADLKAGGSVPQSQLDALAKQADDLEQAIKKV